MESCNIEIYGYYAIWTQKDQTLYDKSSSFLEKAVNDVGKALEPMTKDLLENYYLPVCIENLVKYIVVSFSPSPNLN